MRKISFWILLLSFFISSCINYEQVTILKKDGSGEMFIHYWIHWESSQDSATICQLEIFDQDSIKSEFQTSYNSVDEIETYKQKSDSTIHTKVEISFQNIDSLNNTEIFKISQFSLLQGPEDTQIFSQFVPPMATGFGLQKRPQSLEYTYYIPGRIQKHNADEIDKNKLVWKFTSDEIGTGKYLNVTYKPFKLKETPGWVYYSALIVFFILLFFLFGKKK